MTIADRSAPTEFSRATTLNGPGHLKALTIYLMVVAAHWAEHAVQAFQIYVLDTPRPEALGLLGEIFPFLVESEILHWGYALFMLGGLILMRHSFAGAARRWWTIALGIQVWHFIEHFLLFGQYWSGLHLAGAEVPTSVIQLIVPRVELHLVYNMIVLVPLLVAVSLHWFSDEDEGAAPPPEARCACAARFAVPK
jgi:hypothetical protein